MARDTNLKEFFTDIADAIRERTGITKKMTPEDMLNEMKKIDIGLRYNDYSTFIVPEGMVVSKGDFLQVPHHSNGEIEYANLTSPETIGSFDGVALTDGFPGMEVKVHVFERVY